MFWSLADICLLKIVHNCNFKRSSSSNFKSLKTEQINSHTVCIITKTNSTFSRQQGNYVINSQYTYTFLCEMPVCLHQAHTDRHVLQLFFCDHCERNLPCYHVQQKLMMSTFVAPDSINWNAQCTEGLVVGERGQIESH